jgi:hypothetical protein
VCAEQRVDREGSSPSGARMRSAVSKSGGNSSLPGRVEGMERPERARRRKPETDQCGPGAAAPQFPEGRVSIARWNPKGMRRSTGL